MSQKSSQERRKDPRFFGSVPLKISGDDFDLVTETKNLSKSGAYCRVNQYIEPMTKLRVQFLLPFKHNNRTVTRKISCGAVIVRTESAPADGGYSVAIFFNDIEPRDITTLKDYVANMLKDEAKTQSGAN